uniref:P-type Ca(2+) transporter n=1 Tax=Oryza rufipogon TaxID=4529 RepID=A0A0E0RDH6_ORYRU
MEKLDRYLQENFDVPAKNPSEEAQRRWRQAVGTIVKNRRRRFRWVPDLERRSLDKAKVRSTQEKIRVALYVQQAALIFSDGAKKKEYKLTGDIIKAGYAINPDELALITSKHDSKALKMHGGVDGISIKVRSSFDHGIYASELDTRQNIYGVNRYAEKPSRSFWMFVWDALQDMTLIILMSLQFKELDNEKKKIFIHVTRDGRRQKISIYDLVVGDIVHLSIGDQVPADGLCIHGYSLLIDESSLSGESDPVYVSQDKPFILAGTKVQDGSAKMIVTAVGMRTEWGKLMSTLSEGGEDETPLQVKLNGVATIIGKIGLVFAILTFLVLLVRFLIDKGMTVGLLKWYSTDALTIVNYFATAVTIIVVAVPEGLPLAVTLSLAFAMKKLMNDKALVRHLSACETMGSAGTICTDKTGTLTTNHMVVDKIWISEVSKSVTSNTISGELNSVVSSSTLSLLLQGIFENTSAEVVKEKDGKQTVLGTPTERAILEFGLGLKGDHDAEYRACTKVKVEPFNSVKKKMAVLISLPNGTSRWFCKGASEIILQMCDMMVMARSLPLDKHTLVTNLRGMFDEVVSVTGDGTNDAPALHEADIGLAMGIAGTEVAKESADVIVLDDNFTTIINVARWGRAVYINIQKFVQFQLTVNIVALVINFVSACIIGSAPLTAVQLLWVNMIMDTLGALALATEPPNDEMMKRPPVRKGESFITKFMWRNIMGQSLYQLFVLGALMFGGERLLNIKGADSKSIINTLIFNSFVFCQVFNEINSREMQKINVFRGIISNWIFIAVIAATVAFQVVIIEFLGTFASTVPLNWQHWLLSVGLGSISLIVGVILKCIPVGSGETSATPNGYRPLANGPDDI